MRFRIPVLCLALGLVPLATGCDEIAKATDKNNAEEKTKAETTESSDAAKKARKPSTDFADFPTTDPLIANAIEMRDQLVVQEELLLSRLDELRMLLASAKADRTRMGQSVDEFLEIAKDMRKVSGHAAESVNVMIDSTTELARSTRHLASSYRSAAELFRKKSKDYTEKKLRDQLVSFAREYDEIAASIPARTKTLEDFQRKLPALKVKVREANAFMDDVVLFLSSHPGIGADPKERYSAHFETFAVTFSEWIATLDDIRKVLREHAVSKAIQEGFRKDVAEQNKLELAKRDEEARREQAEWQKKELEKRAEQVRREREELEEAARQARLAVEQKLATERERLASEREEFGKAQAKAAEQRALRSMAAPQPAAANPSAQVDSSPWTTPVVVPQSVSPTITVTESRCTVVQPICWTVIEPCRPVYQTACRYIPLPRPCGCR